MTGYYENSILADSCCVFFNKRIFKDNNIDYPYQDVLDGDWTIDSLMEIITQTTADLDGDMALDCRKDQFGYVNLEQTPFHPEYYDESEDGWKRLANEWGEAAADAGVSYVQSHSPIVNAFSDKYTDSYERALRAARRSIEVCRVLGIDRIVVHASFRPDFTPEQFLSENVRFYHDLLEQTESAGVMILTENVDDSCGELPIATGR